MYADERRNARGFTPVLSALICVHLWLLSGCTREEPKAPATPQVERGPHSVSGIVRLIGTPPPPRVTVEACDPRPGAAKMTHTDRTVLVSADGGLANTYVFVTAVNGAPPPSGSGAGEPPLVLDQQDCYFLPYALPIQVGQTLKIRNSDPTFHNVHWVGKLNRDFNEGFLPSPNSPEKLTSLSHPEFLEVRCDVHPWMTSSMKVFSHPFFAATDSQGRFTLKGLPPGTYTLSTFHPFYGEGQSLSVTLPPPSDSPATTQPAGDLTFTYTAPQPATAPK